MLALGCCVCGVPCAYLIGIRLGPAAGLGAWIVGGVISGIPFDKYLESRFAILVVRPNRSGDKP